MEELTKLEYFTALVMQAKINEFKFYVGKKETQESLQDAAQKSVKIAQAVLDELTKISNKISHEALKGE